MLFLRSHFIAFLILSSTFLTSPTFFDWESQPFEWEKWNLQIEMKDASGLVIKNVSYEGEQMLAKASLPVIRVKYVRE